MTLGFGQNLFPSAPQINAVYDNIDAAQGIGYVNYYGGETRHVSGAISSLKKVYILSKNLFYSDNIFTSGATTNSGNYDLAASLSFSTQFIQPQIIGGKTIINIPMATFSGSGITPGIFALIQIRKYTGSVGTLLVDFTSGGIHAGSGASFIPVVSAIPIEIPKTAFGRNDIFQIDVAAYANANAAGGNTTKGFIAHDPQNRVISTELPDGSNTWGKGTSTLIFQIPFRLEV